MSKMIDLCSIQALQKMGNPPSPILILSLFITGSVFSDAQSLPKPSAFTFPIRKDGGATNQYYTPIQFGSNTTTLNVVIDLGGKFLWFNSIDYFNSASTFRPILCGTEQCRIANGAGCIFCFLSPLVPGCSNNTCSDYALNPFSGTQGYSGLGQDALRVHSTHGDHQYRITNFPFQFSDPVLREGLAAPTAGLVGLGRTKIALQAQLASAFKVREKIALCIPSSGNEGNMIIGQTAYTTPFQAISKSLHTTPLIRNPVSTWPNEIIGNMSVEYFINVNSIRVADTALSLNTTLLSIDKRTGGGGTCIRTVRAYTSLHGSIYDALIAEFVKAAAARNIKRVASVAPFGACFDSNTIGSVQTGPDVPTIDLILQSSISNSNVYWRIYGGNSIVRVSEDVMCLAFVDGTPSVGGLPISSIVVGGYQMENYLLEFDVASSKLRFSSSLLLQGTSCSQFRAA